MATINVKDAAGATVAIEKPLEPGRTAAATSRPVALSDEDFAALAALEALAGVEFNTTLPTLADGEKGIAQGDNRGRRFVKSILINSAEDELDFTQDVGPLLGAVNETPAPTPTTNSGLNGLLRLLANLWLGVAHDAADSGNPLKIGGKAVAALSALTLVASGDRANASFDLDGALIVRDGGAIGDRVSGTASNTDGASTACIAAQASGIKTMLTDITLVNMHATSTIYVEIKDGATVKWVFPVPALGGVTHRWETPLSGTAATAWNFDPSAATTTIYCSMAGRLSKV